MFLSLVTLTLEHGRHFWTVHLTTKFHHRTLHRSEVIVCVNKLTNKQTDAAENMHRAVLCYATPVGKYIQTYQVSSVIKCISLVGIVVPLCSYYTVNTVHRFT